jgi:glycyl-tRNA synthetase
MPTLNFQQMILRLLAYWQEQGCLVQQPYNVQVGAGTMNPASVLRVLGPEPWNVVYVEPSIRPDDGRFGDNPNRMQQHHQLQVILKPDPGNPHRAVPEEPGGHRHQSSASTTSALWKTTGSRRPWARGGWAGRCGSTGRRSPSTPTSSRRAASTLNPVSVEITYGLDRIALALQGKNSVWEMDLRRGRQLWRRPAAKPRSSTATTTSTWPTWTRCEWHLRHL